MSTFINLLGQMEIPTDGTPLFTGDTHGALAWLIIAVTGIAVLLVTFKMSKRTAMDRL